MAIGEFGAAVQLKADACVDDGFTILSVCSGARMCPVLRDTRYKMFWQQFKT
jgi:hypothetical protein